MQLSAINSVNWTTRNNKTSNVERFGLLKIYYNPSTRYLDMLLLGNSPTVSVTYEDRPSTSRYTNDKVEKVIAPVKQAVFDVTHTSLIDSNDKGSSAIAKTENLALEQVKSCLRTQAVSDALKQRGLGTLIESISKLSRETVSMRPVFLAKDETVAIKDADWYEAGIHFEITNLKV